MLDPRRLRVLVEVSRHGSIAAAAESLSFVPSAVSQQITALERELGIDLTERVGRRTSLTPAGVLLVEHAEQLLAGLADAEQAVRELDGARGGRLRVAAFAAAAATIVPAALAAVAARDGNLRVSLVEQDPEHSLAGLARHELDLAVIHRSAAEESLPPSIAERELLVDELVVAAPREHSLAAVRRAPLARFANETWALPPRGTAVHALTARGFRSAGFQPQGAYTTADPLVALRLVGAGLCVAPLARLAVSRLGEPVALVALEAPPARAVLAAWRHADRSESLAVMVELLAGEAERLALSTDSQ